MPPQDFSAALNHLGLTANQFARLIGSQRKRVIGWLEGEKEVPHHVHLIVRLCLESPGVLQYAKRLADEFVVEAEVPDRDSERSGN